jgi:hypothetical protein
VSVHIVRTQAELDAALEAAEGEEWADIDIRSEWGVWLALRAVPDSATVRASGSATVRASAKVAVHLHDARVKVTGGVVIDVSKDVTDPTEWCADNGVTVSRAGVATVYKAVDDAYRSGYGTAYEPGSKPSAPDWRDDHDCGGGLHFSPTPFQAQAYAEEATRFLAVGVKLADLRPIPGGTAKCKAPRVVRACVEVDIDGKPVTR